MSKQYMKSEFQILIQDLFNLQRLGVKKGLGHTFQLLDACANPHKRLKFIHLAGTNGKGSTASFIHSILRSSGLKVGLYTSPHLIRFNERIRVNGIPITNEKIVEFMQLYSDDIKRIESTFFETTTTMALWYFEQENVDIAIIETGLGGRLDSTNVITPAISVITPISMDHCELLGNKLKSIAQEKAGIIKENIPVVSGFQEKIVKEVLTEKAIEMKTQVMFINKPQKSVVTIDGTYFKEDKIEYSLSLIGKHQAQNASLAIKAIRGISYSVKEGHIKTGIENAYWPGRFQVVSRNPFVIYDVAHNVRGIETAVQTYRNIFEHKPIGLFALKEDKELKLIIRSLKNQFEKLFVIDDKNGLLMRANDLSLILNNHGIKSEPIKGLKNFTSYLKNNHSGIIFGSHYIAEAVFNHFQFSFDSGAI